MSKEAMKQALEALIAATPVKAKDPHLQATAIVALQEALAGPTTGWQPIETAPKDGTVVFLYGTWDDCTKGRYASISGDKTTAIGHLAKTFTGNCEWFASGIDRRGNSVEWWIIPTHSMPLPKPPEGAE